MAKKVTLQHVADHAKVGVVTASVVLSGKQAQGRISQATADRVRASAAELGYHARQKHSPQPAAPKTIGLLLQWTYLYGCENSFTQAIYGAIARVAWQNNFQLLFCSALGSSHLETAKLIKASGVSGVLAVRDAGDPLTCMLHEMGVPVVSLFGPAPREDIPCFDADNYEAGLQVARHLIGLGHKRIGSLMAEPQVANSRARLQGLLDGMTEAGIEPDRSLQVVALAGAFDTIVESYLRSVSRPTAVFCYCDAFALSVIQAAKRLGLSVPGDLSVVGFDSFRECEASDPPLTSVYQPVSEIAGRGAAHLVRMISGECDEIERVSMGVSLDIRGSSGSVKAD